MARRPFNMLAGVFYLLATVILVQVFASTLAGLLCYYTNITTVQQIGACLPVTDAIQQQWDKIIEAVLALLVAATARLPPPNGGGTGGGSGESAVRSTEPPRPPDAADDRREPSP